MPRARRPLLTLFLAAALAALHLVAAPGTPTASAESRTLKVLLLGDSYSAGNAAGSYIEGSPSNCYRSSQNWAQRFARARTAAGLTTAVTNQACSNAIIGDYWNAQENRTVPPQKSWVNNNWDLFLMTFGGNDVGFKDIAWDCLSPMWGYSKCDRSLDVAEAKLASGKVEADLFAMMMDLRRSSRTDAKIVLMGYPLLSRAGCATQNHPYAARSSRVRALGDAADRLQRRVVLRVAAQAELEGRPGNIAFIPVSGDYEGKGFANHEPGVRFSSVFIPSACGKNDDSWIREAGSATISKDTFVHPLPRGQQAYADRLGYTVLADNTVFAKWTPTSWNPSTGGGGSVPTPVLNKLPIAKISYSRINGTPGKVYLNGSGSNDPDGNTAALKYEWLVGGSLKATTMNASMVFPTGSTQNITLRVTDEKGGVGLASQSIYLVNRAPTFSGMSPENGHIAGSNQPVLGATATDLDGDKLTYSYRITGDRVDVPSDATVTGTQWTVPPSRLDPGAKYTWSVTVSDGTTSVTSTRNISIAMLPVAADVVSTASGQGYWQVASDGGVFTHGDAQFYGSVPGLGLRLTNLMGMARTPSGNGYWVVGSDGGVFSFGDAAFYGSLPGQNIRVNNITGMVPTKSGKGYWLVGTDGGVFSFGDAQFYGSMGGKPLNKPVTAMAATASGGGYWLVARDGGIFSFGDAPFYGSMGGQQLNHPVVDMDVTPDGGGYWLTAEDGGVFSFGNAQFYGSMAGKQLNGHINGMASTPSGRGYWLNGCDGGVFTFGDAPFKGAASTYQCRGIFYQ